MFRRCGGQVNVHSALPVYCVTTGVSFCHIALEKDALLHLLFIDFSQLWREVLLNRCALLLLLVVVLVVG